MGRSHNGNESPSGNRRQPGKIQLKEQQHTHNEGVWQKNRKKLLSALLKNSKKVELFTKWSRKHLCL